MMKIIIRITAAMLLLPGFVFDILVGVAFILNDGRSSGAGDSLGEWVFAQAMLIPDVLQLPFMLTVYVCALPAGALVVVTALGLLVGIAYVMINVVTMIICAPITGKLEWGIIFKD